MAQHFPWHLEWLTSDRLIFGTYLFVNVAVAVTLTKQGY